MTRPDRNSTLVAMNAIPNRFAARPKPLPPHSSMAPAIPPEPMTHSSPPAQPKPVKTAPHIRKLGKRLSIQNTSPVTGLGCIAIWFRGRLVINIHLIRWMICLG